jgi:mono/diheme cytochrome c family protein
MKPTVAIWISCLGLTSLIQAGEPIDYARDIKPIFAQHCYACHGADKQKSGLRLDTASAAIKGGNSGPGIVAGQSEGSRLYKAITGADGVTRMPPREPQLSAQQVALVKAWIDQGAKTPARETPGRSSVSPSAQWAFKAPAWPVVPAVQATTWDHNAIDRFILARLEKNGLTPSPEANRETLIRRVSLDLIGLSPAPSEVEAFVNDPSPDVYERLVDRLLASPHYGERWGRHWLDLARYADSNGFNIDAPRSIWKYRDWVIGAFNRDLPFDQFTIEQIAGDLLPKPTRDQLIATGFHRNTLINEEGGIDLEQFRVESLVDRVNTTGAVFLGLTLGCAQCHDHKFDPIAQREYYQLLAFYNNADEPTLEVPTSEQRDQVRRIRAEINQLRNQLHGIDLTSAEKRRTWEKKLSFADLDKLSSPIRAILEIPEVQRSPEQKKKLDAVYAVGDHSRHLLGGLGQPIPWVPAVHLYTGLVRIALEKQIAELQQREPAIVTTLVMRERKEPRTTHVHLGGDFLRKGARVEPGTPQVLHPLLSHQGRPANRLDLAHWLLDPRNPLTARVVMNRFWQHYFGLGLVETENDFGTQGTPPSHPELLDWLAREFIARRWSMKEMHRLIVTSATYRQSSHYGSDLDSIDPRNRLLARQSRLRLDAEIIRDAGLTASGLLAPLIGGPSVFPPQPDGVFRLTQIQREWKPDADANRFRRGLYTFFWRSAPYPASTVFDAPESTTTCTRRNRSNTPLQALTLLNDPAYFEMAQGLARRILREAPPTDSARLGLGFQLCLGRSPTDRELERLQTLLVSAPDPQPLETWTTVARVLLNLDEFMTRE